MSERTGTKTAVFADLKSPRIKASASEMAEFLDSYADQLRHVAEQLRAKGEGEVVTLPWPPGGFHIDCNGGGDG